MYKDPLSSRVFDNVYDYQSYLVEIHYGLTQDLGWKNVREGKAKFKVVYDELHALNTISDIMAWLSANPDRLMFSPLVDRPLDKVTSSFTRFVPFTSKFFPDASYKHFDYTYPDLNHQLEGSCWTIKASIWMPQTQTPRFVAYDLWRGMNSLGLYIIDHAFSGREGDMMRYDIKIALLAKEWPTMTTLYKLAGKITGPIKFETEVV